MSGGMVRMPTVFEEEDEPVEAPLNLRSPALQGLSKKNDILQRTAPAASTPVATPTPTPKRDPLRDAAMPIPMEDAAAPEGDSRAWVQNGVIYVQDPSGQTHDSSQQDFATFHSNADPETKRQISIVSNFKDLVGRANLKGALKTDPNTQYYYGPAMEQHLGKLGRL